MRDNNKKLFDKDWILLKKLRVYLTQRAHMKMIIKSY